MILEEVSVRTDFGMVSYRNWPGPARQRRELQAIRWVRSQVSPGATRHLIHGLDVCASRPRATAAMPRRLHGATGGATASGAICGTYAPIASERARPIGAGRFAGMNLR